jgi:hypothetical protein
MFCLWPVGVFLLLGPVLSRRQGDPPSQVISHRLEGEFELVFHYSVLKNSVAASYLLYGLEGQQRLAGGANHR